jgi:hypothetical protein
MITPEQHAEIRRLYYGEHWKVGTIAAALGVHHDTVRAAIVNDTQGVRRGTSRATQLDPYLPFVRDTLAQYPRLRATRLFEMVKGRGYAGSVVQLRRAVRLIRPAATATVYRRLVTLAGEEAQVDWGAFGSIRIGRGVRPLSRGRRPSEILQQAAQRFEDRRRQCSDERRHLSRIDGFSNRHRVGQHEPDGCARHDESKHANEPHEAEAQAAERVVARKAGGHDYARSGSYTPAPHRGGVRSVQKTSQVDYARFGL